MQQASAVRAWAAPAGARTLAAARPHRSQQQRRQHVARSAEGMSWLEEQAGSVEEASVKDAALAAAAAADEAAAASVGLHLRGRATFVDGATNEDDPARFDFNRRLREAAMGGSVDDAEAVLAEMTRAGLPPGPRAYHALVFAFVKHRQPSGALAAIRRSWDAGITPMPETYAAVVAAHVAAGDLDTAEAVLASNRRAGVDCTKSWQQLVLGLLRAKQGVRAMEAYSQGEAEGLVPSEAVCEGLVLHLCSAGDLDAAYSLMQQMKAWGQSPTVGHLKPLIDAYAAARDAQGASRAVAELLSSAKATPAVKQALYDTVLETQLAVASSGEEAAAAVQAMTAQLTNASMQPSQRYLLAHLRAGLRFGDVQMASSAFRQLRKSLAKAAAMLTDAELASLLLLISRADQPAELYDVLSAMCSERRPLPAAAMQPDEHGCTILGSWARHRMQLLEHAQWQQTQGGQEGVADSAALIIDGVRLHPQLLCALDAEGTPLAVSRMGVRELRAELAARRAPVSGNKKELSKRLQALRQPEEGQGTTHRVPRSLAARGDWRGGTAKMMVTVTDQVWVWGRMVEETTYEVEQDEEAPAGEEGADDDGGGGMGDWEGEEEEFSRRGASSMPDEDTLFDEEGEGDDADLEAALGVLSGRISGAAHTLAPAAAFSSPLAGPYEAAAMALAAVVTLGAQPSAADLHALAGYARASADPAAAVLLAAVLDSQREQAVEGDWLALRGELAVAATRAAEFDFEAAVAAVVGSAQKEVEAQAVMEEMADFMQPDMAGFRR